MSDHRRADRPARNAPRPSTRSTRPTGTWSARTRSPAAPRSTPPWPARASAVGWWGNLSFDERADFLLTWRSVMTRRMAQLADLVAPRDRQAAQRRPARDRPRHRAHRLGGQERQEGARGAQGLLRSPDGQPGRHRGVPPARRGRRDRPVELPGLHADGVDRLRPGRGQRGRVQAERVHARRRAVARRLVPRGGARPRRAAGRDRPRGHRQRAVPGADRQARLHRLRPDRQAGHGGLRREPHPGGHRGRGQGLADRRRGRRPSQGGGGRAVGRDGQRRADLHRHRARLRPRERLRRVHDRDPRPGRGAARRGRRRRAGSGRSRCPRSSP